MGGRETSVVALLNTIVHFQPTYVFSHSPSLSFLYFHGFSIQSEESPVRTYSFRLLIYYFHLSSFTLSLHQPCDKIHASSMPQLTLAHANTTNNIVSYCHSDIHYYYYCCYCCCSTLMIKSNSAIQVFTYKNVCF